MEASDCEMIIHPSEVFDGKAFLFCSLVLQLVTGMFPHHLLWWLPLYKGSIPYGGADHHSGFTRHWKIGQYLLLTMLIIHAVIPSDATILVVGL